MDLPDGDRSWIVLPGDPQGDRPPGGSSRPSRPRPLRPRTSRAKIVGGAVALLMLVGVLVAFKSHGQIDDGAAAATTQVRSQVVTTTGTVVAADGTPTPTTSAARPGLDSTNMSVAFAALDRLVVAPADPTIPKYDRHAFSGGEWSYDPSTGCNTRELVLIQESLDPPVVNDRCHPLSGRWYSRYDGVITTDPTDLQIDHLVPVADVWRSGAYRWTDERRGGVLQRPRRFSDARRGHVAPQYREVRLHPRRMAST